MAETKKKTTAKSGEAKETTAPKTRKSTTKKSVIEEPTPTVVIETPVEKVEVPVVPTPVKKVYQATDMIPCKSVRYGILQHVSKKSGDIYEWADYGDITEVAYGDLLALKSRKSKFLYAPWFLILDEQLVDDWNLNGVYEFFNEFDDIEDFLQSGAISLRKKLPQAPQGFKDLVVHKAGEMLRNGALDSIGTVRAIDDVLHKNLADLIGGR